MSDFVSLATTSPAGSDTASAGLSWVTTHGTPGIAAVPDGFAPVLPQEAAVDVLRRS